MTVEGWIKDAHGVVALWKQREGGWVVLDVPSSVATVVFSPEPVTFEDGDAIRYLGGTVYNRVYGQWHMGADSIASPYSDGWASEAVRGGSAVKLVPEANGD